MRTRLLLPIALLAAAVCAHAQTFDEYVKLRKTNGVSRQADRAALEAFVGTRVIELGALVRGVVKSGDRKLLILEREGGEQLFVQCPDAPDWLVSNASARLLMKVTRTGENSALEAELLGAASESQMATWEQTNRPKPRVSGSSTSRKGGRPPAVPGTLLGPTAGGSLDHGTVSAYSSFIRGQNRRLSQAQSDRIATGILGYSDQFGVDARLVMALVLCESGFNPGSRSSAGAMGLGQLMPGTARELGVSNAYDTEQNLYGTVKLLRGHLDKYGAKTGDSFESLVLSLAAYNAGPGAVSRHGGVPPYRETQNYVRKVVDTYRQLCGG
ncbi:MAG: lytic transglycosylase domain-containing protein [Fimbriimonadaceae bacterium]